MDDMERFRRNAEKLGLCDTFAQRWSNCKSKKQLYDLACDINSLSYMAEMIAKGYGLSSDYLVKEFGQFLNGKCTYKSREDGYTSQMYCQYDGSEIEVKTTALLLIDVHNVRIVADRICEIYMVNSEVEIVGRSHAIVYSYNSAVTNPDSSPAVVRYNE